MKNKLSLILFVLSVVFSYAQVDLTPDQLEPIELEKISSTETTSYFGNSISFSADGSVLAIGEYGYGTTSTVSSGRVMVYTNESGSWTQKGQDILGIDDSFNTFGKKVELSSDGNTLAVYDSQIGITLNPGQTLEDLYGSLAPEYFPYIQVYQFSNTTWSQIGGDFLFNDLDDYSDMSLSGDGLSIAIATKSGTQAYAFVSNSWSITGQEILSEDVLFDDTIQLSEDGQTLIFGDPFHSDPNSTSQFSYEGRVKVYQKSSNTWTQKGSTINGTDVLGYFGSLVSISADGNTIAIGTAQTSNNDYIAILEFVGGNWVSKGTNIQQIGSSIISMELSDDGNAIVIGESFPYTARVLKYDTEWEQVNMPALGDAVSDQHGFAVTISGNGNRYAVGAPSTETTGANGYVSIYEHNKNSVTRFGNEIYGYGSYDTLGSGVAVSGDGNTIAVGANGSHNDNGTLMYGHVRVFEKTTNGLQQIGSDIRNVTDFDSGSFGTEVELNADGTLLAVSAPYTYSSDWGAVYIYERNGNTWDPLGNVINGVAYSNTGFSLSFSDDGSILAVGSRGTGSSVAVNEHKGYTTVYEYNNTTNSWDTLGQQIIGEAAWDFSGGSIDLSGDGTILAIGAVGNDGVTASGGHGHARVFEYIGSNWVQKGSDVDGDPSTNVNFGGVVTLSHDGNTLIVSDLNYGSGAGSVEIFNWDDISTNWVSETILVNTSTGLNGFGSGTAISDDANILAVGEFQGFGKAHVYVKDDTGTWVDSHLFLNGNHNGSQNFGGNLSLSSNGNTLVVGSRGHNENGTRTGMAAVYHLNLCSSVDGFEVFTGAVDNPVPPSDNLIVNGNAEILPVTDNGWISVSGNWEWTLSNNQGVPIEYGHKYFKTTATGSGELYQDVDVSSLSATIDANNQYFYFSTYLQSFASSQIDDSQAIVEYRDASGNVLSTYDTGLSQNTQEWELFENTRLAPALTRTIRVRLIVTNNGQFGAPNAFIDNVFLRTEDNPSKIDIPDPNFEQALIALGIDTSGLLDGEMLEIDALGVVDLDVSDKNIADLTGIEFFTDLETLTAGDNVLSSLDLTQNTALTSLQLAQNDLTSLDVTNTTNLSVLDLNNNELTTIDLTNNINLTQLFINANNLNQLDVTNNSLLTQLFVNENNLSTIDVSPLIDLINFEIANNSLVNLDVSQNENLISLFCNDNELVTLNVQNGNNVILTDFDAQNNSELICINVDDVTYSEDNWTLIDEQTFFSINCFNLINIPDSNFEQALIALGIDSDGVVNGEMLEIDALVVTNLDVSGENISDLTGIEYFRALGELLATDNNLSSIDFGTIENVTSITLDNNQLSALDVSNFLNLELLSLDSNQLSVLDVSTAINLTELSLDVNQLMTINLAANTELIHLNLANNTLTDINVKDLTLLETLNVSGNLLTSLNLNFNSNLLSLDCSNNQLASLTIRNGNNANITGANFDATNNPDLFCANVDNANYSQTTWLNRDAQTSFLVDCLATNPNNLVFNGSAEILPILENGWTQVTGNWLGAPTSIVEQDGINVFFAGANPSAELYQEVNVTPFSTEIDAGLQVFYFSCYLRSYNQNPADPSRVLVEYKDTLGNVLTSYDTGLSSNTSMWVKFADSRLAPVGTRTIKISLFSTRNSGSNNDGWIDDILLMDASSLIVNIPDPNFEQALIDLDIDSDGIINGQILQPDAVGETYLDVNSRNISDLTGIEFFANLENLLAFNNNLSSVDVSQNLALNGLVLSLNNLSAIDVSNNTNLASLVLGDNQITTINLANNSALTQLYLQNNQLLNIDVSMLPLLAQIDVTENDLVELDVTQNPLLTQVLCSNNNLVNLNLQNGNNANIDEASFDATLNNNLTCIQVDDVNYSNSTWTLFDAQSFFGLSCTPDNDDCFDANSITLAQAIPGTTESSTPSGIQPSCAQGNSVIFDVWYEFIAPSSGSIAMTLDAGSFVGKAAVYENCNAQNPIACAEGDLQLNNLTVGQTYYIQVWLEPSTGGRNDDSVPDEVGSFVLNVQDAATLSVESLDSENQQFYMFPNPALNQVTIRSSALLNTIKLFNVSGQLILEHHPNTLESVIELNSISGGVYFVQAQGDLGFETKKLIIK